MVRRYKTKKKNVIKLNAFYENFINVNKNTKDKDEKNT